LLLYATNVVNNKGEEVFKVMRMSNRMLRARLLTHGGGLRCILCLGFRPVSMGRDTWLVMVDMPKELPNLQVLNHKPHTPNPKLVDMPKEIPYLQVS
jgi:hypothetical protein